jgi:hypothetical protein
MLNSSNAVPKMKQKLMPRVVYIVTMSMGPAIIPISRKVQYKPVALPENPGVDCSDISTIDVTDYSCVEAFNECWKKNGLERRCEAVKDYAKAFDHDTRDDKRSRSGSVAHSTDTNGSQAGSNSSKSYHDTLVHEIMQEDGHTR